jgi:hypothetical protein
VIARALVDLPNISESEGWDIVDASRMAPHIPFPLMPDASFEELLGSIFED